MFHTLTFGGATALTRNGNWVKKKNKTEIGHVTMNIQEACCLIWEANAVFQYPYYPYLLA